MLCNYGISIIRLETRGWCQRHRVHAEAWSSHFTYECVPSEEGARDGKYQSSVLEAVRGNLCWIHMLRSPQGAGQSPTQSNIRSSRYFDQNTKFSPVSKQNQLIDISPTPLFVRSDKLCKGSFSWQLILILYTPFCICSALVYVQLSKRIKRSAFMPALFCTGYLCLQLPPCLATSPICKRKGSGECWKAFGWSLWKGKGGAGKEPSCCRNLWITASWLESIHIYLPHLLWWERWIAFAENQL